MSISLPNRSLNTYTPENYPRSFFTGVTLGDGVDGEDISYGLAVRFLEDGFSTEQLGSFTTTVTGYNKADKVIEGTFSAVLYKTEGEDNLSAPDSLVITDGRFVASELSLNF
ncbi:MAG: hypothetical protein AAF734_04420 [Bacteroidota bacterium]